MRDRRASSTGESAGVVARQFRARCRTARIGRRKEAAGARGRRTNGPAGATVSRPRVGSSLVKGDRSTPSLVPREGSGVAQHPRLSATPDWLRDQARVARLVNAKVGGDPHQWVLIANLARRCAVLVAEPSGVGRRKRLRDAARSAVELARVLPRLDQASLLSRPAPSEDLPGALDRLTADLAALIANMAVVEPTAAAETVAAIAEVLAHHCVAPHPRRWGRRS